MGITAINFAIGIRALWTLVSGQYDIAIGDGAGARLAMGSCVILIGDHIDVPAPDTSFYINIDGTEYPNSARAELWLQALARQRARALVEKYLTDASPVVRHFGQQARIEALKAIDEMSFYEAECAEKLS